MPHSLKQLHVRGHVLVVIDPEHVLGHHTGVPQHVAAVVVVASETVAQLAVLAQEVDIVHGDVRVKAATAAAAGQVVHPAVDAETAIVERAREPREDVVGDVGGAEELLLRRGVETARTAAGVAQEDAVEGDELAVDLEIDDFDGLAGDACRAGEEGERGGLLGEGAGAGVVVGVVVGVGVGVGVGLAGERRGVLVAGARGGGEGAAGGGEEVRVRADGSGGQRRRRRKRAEESGERRRRPPRRAPGTLAQNRSHSAGRAADCATPLRTAPHLATSQPPPPHRPRPPTTTYDHHRKPPPPRRNDSSRK